MHAVRIGTFKGRNKNKIKISIIIKISEKKGSLFSIRSTLMVDKKLKVYLDYSDNSAFFFFFQKLLSSPPSLLVL